MNQKGKKSIVDALVNVAESKNDCVKDSSKKISLSFRSKVKQGSSFLFKSVRTAVRSTSPIKKEVTISDLLTSTEISGSMNDVIIPSIEVDRISHLKRVKQVVKEALFGKGNQASLNQVPSEKLVLEKQSSMLQYCVLYCSIFFLRQDNHPFFAKIAIYQANLFHFLGHSPFSS